MIWTSPAKWGGSKPGTSGRPHPSRAGTIDAENADAASLVAQGAVSIALCGMLISPAGQIVHPRQISHTIISDGSRTQSGAGSLYLDVFLQKIILWTGSSWVDPTGGLPADQGAAATLRTWPVGTPNLSRMLWPASIPYNTVSVRGLSKVYTNTQPGLFDAPSSDISALTGAGAIVIAASGESNARPAPTTPGALYVDFGMGLLIVADGLHYRSAWSGEIL